MAASPTSRGSDCMRRTETIVDVAQQNHARFDGKPIPTTNRSSSSAALRSNWSEWASSPARRQRREPSIERCDQPVQVPQLGFQLADLEPPPRHCAEPDNLLAVDTLLQPNAALSEAAHHKLALTSREPPKVRRLRGMRRTRLDSDSRSRNLTVPLGWCHTGHIALTRPSRWDPVSVPNLLSCNANGHVSVFAPWDA